MASCTKRVSVLLNEKQIVFLRNLSKRIEKQGHGKMSRCKIMKVLTKVLTCIKKRDIHECTSEQELEKELLRCFKKAVKELKGP